MPVPPAMEDDPRHGREAYPGSTAPVQVRYPRRAGGEANSNTRHPAKESNFAARTSWKPRGKLLRIAATRRVRRPGALSSHVHHAFERHRQGRTYQLPVLRQPHRPSGHHGGGL
jgi:hypothetical protein